MIKDRIKEYCNTLGLDLIGFIKCREFNELREFYNKRKELNIENAFEENDIDKRINPMHYMSAGKTIITIAFPYLFDINYKDNGFSVYTRGEDYHKILKLYLDKICNYISEELNGNTLSFVDSNTLPERYIAYLGGIGYIGKNNLLITKEYGSYVFLGEIIMDLEIENYDNENINFEDVFKFKHCRNCNICYDKCPTKAINNSLKNSNICLSYITQQKDIEDKWFSLLNGRVFGCDTCQNYCPHNMKIKKSSIIEFYPLDFANNCNIDDIISINKGDFNKTLKRTSCGWRGKNVLSRNALIKKYMFDNDDIKDLTITSTYVEEYKNRLLKIKKL